jgi:hypothetical protein
VVEPVRSLMGRKDGHEGPLGGVGTLRQISGPHKFVSRLEPQHLLTSQKLRASFVAGARS